MAVAAAAAAADRIMCGGHYPWSRFYNQLESEIHRWTSLCTHLTDAPTVIRASLQQSRSDSEDQTCTISVRPRLALNYVSQLVIAARPSDSKKTGSKNTSYRVSLTALQHAGELEVIVPEGQDSVCSTF